jgi:hypothetical protein
VSSWDKACIVWDVFHKYYRCCYPEDAGKQKESRPVPSQDQTSTPLPCNTPVFFSLGWCAEVLSAGNRHRTFYIPWYLRISDKRNKNYSAIWFEEIPVTIFLDWEVIHPKNDDDCFTFLHYPTRLFWTSPPVSSAV